LKWIFERTEDTVKAVDTPIGLLPTPDSVDISGLSVSADDMKELLTVNKTEWLAEVEGIREHYAKFGSRLPKELQDELKDLEQRLKK
jgi:phosphoenolpyruvate carboxykinase (GTP)